MIKLVALTFLFYMIAGYAFFVLAVILRSLFDMSGDGIIQKIRYNNRFKNLRGYNFIPVDIIEIIIIIAWPAGVLFLFISVFGFVKTYLKDKHEER